MCLTRRREYGATPSAIGAARDFVSAFVVATLDPRGWSVADDAALVVSEFVTSAIEAGCGEVDVAASLHRDRLELTIQGQQPVASPGRLTGLRGAVVHEVANRAELERTADGTLRGTAQLPCRAEWTATVPCSETG